MSLPILEETLNQHRSKMTAFQNKQISKVMNKGLLAIAKSILNDRSLNTLEIDLAFVVVETNNMNQFVKHANQMPKNTINALVKKGVLKEIELHVCWKIVRVWIITGVGLSKNQFNNSWLKLEGIDPNADREMERNRRTEIVNNIKTFCINQKAKQ